MEKLCRWLLLAWFVVMSLFFFIASWRVLSGMPDIPSAYRLVVNESLLTLLERVILVLLGFAFTKNGAIAVSNYFASKYNHPDKIQEIRLF